jgi:hypothetical protein
MAGSVLTAVSRSFYPTMGSSTLGGAASAASPFVGNSVVEASANTTISSPPSPEGGMAAADPHTQRAISVAATGKPLPFWIGLIIMLLAIGWLSQRFGTQGEDFRSIKVSAYNTIIISLTAIVGIAALKALFTRHPVPGLTSLINSV